MEDQSSWGKARKEKLILINIFVTVHSEQTRDLKKFLVTIKRYINQDNTNRNETISIPELIFSCLHLSSTTVPPICMHTKIVCREGA